MLCVDLVDAGVISGRRGDEEQDRATFVRMPDDFDAHSVAGLGDRGDVVDQLMVADRMRSQFEA